MGNLIKKKKNLSAENPLLAYAQYTHSTPRVPYTKMAPSTCHVPPSVPLLFLLPEKILSVPQCLAQLSVTPLGTLLKVCYRVSSLMQM